MVATRAIIRKKVEGLHLVAVPSTSLQADLLIGAGSVASLLTGSILLYEYGQANRFIAAQKAGSIVVKDSTCPAIHAALIAGEKGLPFMPVRGLIGSDILRHRMADDGWQTINNPFGEDDPVVVVPPLRPDVTLFHVPLADRFGNVWIGRRAEFATMARASAKTLVTFEAFFDGNLMADEDKAPATIPAFYVTAVSHQPKGAWPLHGGDAYGEDASNLREYAEQSKTVTGFAEYLTRYVLDIDEAA
jgi:glutaconate CoA-transferase subunit A